MSVLRHEGAAALEAKRDRIERDFGHRLEFMSREQVQASLVSAKYFQALRDPSAFHFHPLNYLRGIAAEIERLGGRSSSRARWWLSISKDPSRLSRQPRGKVAARDVLFAGGGYIGRLVPALARSFIPIATYVLLTESAPSAFVRRSALPMRSATTAAPATTTAVSRAASASSGAARSPPASPIRAIWRSGCAGAMVATFPQLEGVKVEAAWSGLMSYARHLMPQIGRLQPHVWYCTAFGGHGMNTTAIGGKIVAEAITGESDRIRLFEPFGLVVDLRTLWAAPRCSSPIGACRRRIGGRSAGEVTTRAARSFPSPPLLFLPRPRNGGEGRGEGVPVDRTG